MSHWSVAMAGDEKVLQEILASLALVKVSVEQLGSKVEQLGSKVEQIDSKVERMDAKVERMDAKIDQMDAKFESELKQLNYRVSLLEPLHDKFDALQLRMENVEAKVESTDSVVALLSSSVVRISEHLIPSILKSIQFLEIDMKDVKVRLSKLEDSGSNGNGKSDPE